MCMLALDLYAQHLLRSTVEEVYRHIFTFSSPVTAAVIIQVPICILWFQI